MKKYFDVEILVSDGELEDTRNVVIEADDLGIATKRANMIARGWFKRPSYKSLGWWYCPEAGRSVKAGKVAETTPGRFLQSRLMVA